MYLSSGFLIMVVYAAILFSGCVSIKVPGFNLNTLTTKNRNEEETRKYMVAAALKSPPQQAERLDVRDKTTQPVIHKTSHRGLMLLFYGSLGSVMPFIPMYYRSLGIQEKYIGMLGAITPAVTFIVSPLWGILADTTGKHKLIMLLTFVGSVLLRCLIGLQGSAEASVSVPLLALLVAGSALLNAPVKPLMDSAVMSTLEDKADYGKSRLFGQLGFGLGSYAVGPFLGKKNIRMIFAAHGLISLPTAVAMGMMSFDLRSLKKEERKEKAAGANVDMSGPALKVEKEKKKERVRLRKALRHVYSDANVMAFFFVVFVIGVSSGIVENFAYVRMAEVGSGDSGNSLGVCRLCSSLAGGPMFWLSGRLLGAIGVNGVLTMSLVSYTLRFLIYASIRNPWQALPAEILRGITFASFWASSTCYVYNVSPPELTATMLAMLNGIYGGLGQSIGSLIGGALSNRLGISRAFLYCGAVCAAVVAVFGIYQLYYFRYFAELIQSERMKTIEKKRENK